MVKVFQDTLLSFEGSHFFVTGGVKHLENFHSFLLEFVSCYQWDFMTRKCEITFRKRTWFVKFQLSFILSSENKRKSERERERTKEQVALDLVKTEPLENKSAGSCCPEAIVRKTQEAIQFQTTKWVFLRCCQKQQVELCAVLWTLKQYVTTLRVWTALLEAQALDDLRTSARQT